MLQGEGILINGEEAARVAFEFKEKTYVETGKIRKSFTRTTLLSLAANGRFVGTFTARHGVKVGIDNPQPGIWTWGPIQAQSGRQKFPVLSPDKTIMTISGRHIQEGAHLIVDGRRVPGTFTSQQGAFYDMDITVKLETLPAEGIHFLQLQNPDGMFSNDFIFHVTYERTDDTSSTSSQNPKNNSNFLNRVLKRLQTTPK